MLTTSRLIRTVALLAVIAMTAACAGGGDSGDGRGGGDRASVPGVTDTEIKLGTFMPLSQTPASAYAPMADAMTAYFAYVNDAEGGVHGRKITLIVGDDHYSPPDTVEVVRRLVERDNVFAIVSGLGDPTHLAVWKYLEERGVPDLFIASGLSRWTDPVVRTRFGGNPVYLQEGEMLGRYIAKEHAGKRLGVLVENSEGSLEGLQGVRRGIEGSDIDVVVETYETVQWDVTAQTQRLKSAGADVIVVYALPPPAASLVKTAREVLDWDVPIVLTGVDATELFLDLAGSANAEGMVSVIFGHQVYETDNPGIRKHHEIMQKYAPNVAPSNITLYGATMAQFLVEGLKRAGRDLTRDSLIDALESMRDVPCDVCFAPISMSPTDHRPIEIERYIRVENGKWVPFGDLVDFESTR
ncbi:MAG: ABC transporter substrate-binding protein [Chloroflexi bacterium]|nr:ABC transporter substrate-binding protein [Chloroflexota bacterium]